jgi:hypothetical protein
MGLSTAVKTAMPGVDYSDSGLNDYSCAYWSWLVYQEVTVSGGVVWYPRRFSK